MGFTDHGADAWKRDRIHFAFQGKPDCLNLYSRATVLECVSDYDVARHFERYTIVHPNHSDERYYVVTLHGEQIAVRGLIHAKFLCFHHFMEEKAAQSRCLFEESYGFKSGKKRSRESGKGERSELEDNNAGEDGAPVGTPADPIPVSSEPGRGTPTQQQTPQQKQTAKRARRASTPGNSESHTADFSTGQDHAALRELLEREIGKLEYAMRQVQERENAARAARVEVEKAARDSRARLAEIEEQCAALQREASAVNVEVELLDSERQAAADEEESCREECKELQDSRDRAAADLHAASEAEAAQRELHKAEQLLEERRRVLEEKNLAAHAAWQRAGQLEQEQQSRKEEEERVRAREQAREQAEWEEKCMREAAEAKAREEAEAEADRQRRAEAEADQAFISDEPRTARQKAAKIGLLRSRLEVLIMIVGSGKAIDLLKKSLKKAYKQAALDTHGDKGNNNEDAIKELNSVKSSLERLGGW